MAPTFIQSLPHERSECLGYQLPARGQILDALKKGALAFYQRFELFQPFPNDPMRLFVPMKVVEPI